MDMSMDNHMKMSVWLGADCTFIFKSWTTSSTDYLLFIIGCLCTLVFCLIHSYIPHLQQHLQDKATKTIEIDNT